MITLEIGQLYGMSSIKELMQTIKELKNTGMSDDDIQVILDRSKAESEDAISRDDALKALDYDIKSFEFKSGVGKHMNEIANLLNTIYEIQSDNIKALPPVQPKPKTGHWIKITPSGIYMCSECEQNVLTGDIDVYQYCHQCGARMVKSNMLEIPKGSESEDADERG